MTDRHTDQYGGAAEWCLTEGVALENNPNRDRGGADGRKRVGDLRAVGEAGWPMKIERSSPI